MVPLDRAIAIVDKQIEPFRVRGEWLPVRQAQGRALLAPARSRLDLPAPEATARGAQPPPAGQVRRGDEVLEAGTTLGPLEVALLVSCGLERVRAGRRPRVAVLTVGEEIVDGPAEWTPGRTMNAVGPLLAHLADRYGLEVVLERRVGDDARGMSATIRSALAGAEIVVMAGGAGPAGAALVKAGLDVHFDNVAVRPGSSVTFATRKGKAVFVLPGEAGSAFLMFHVFVLRAAAGLSGGAWPVREFVMTLGFDYKRDSGEGSEFVPCRIAPNGRLEKVEFRGWSDLSALAQADGFCFVPAGCVMIGFGQNVLFLPVMRAWR